MKQSKSYMEDMTKTIGDNQGRIGFLESLNKQLEGTVQVKHQQTEEVCFSFPLFSFFSVFLLVNAQARGHKFCQTHFNSVCSEIPCKMFNADGW